MIALHLGAFEYDWRARFHLPLRVVGTKAMTWGEAHRLATQLASDPASAVAAALAGWEHTVSWEALALYDLYDLQHMAKARKRPKPYPRPWATAESTHKGTGSYTTAELDAVLAATRPHLGGD